MSAKRSLPERTVDAWVTSAITTMFPHALIWAPTQVPADTNWDFGIEFGAGNIFILEDKATPDQAAYRTRSPSGPFEQWAFVILCTDLRKILDGTRRLNTARLPLENSSKFADLLQSAREGRIGKRFPVRNEDTEDRLGKAPDGINDPLAAQAEAVGTKGSALIIIPDSDMQRI